MTRAQLDKRPADVSAMFDKVADRYDLLNDALSLGMDRLWRRVVARAVGAGPGQLVLDLAAGTGTSSRAFTAGGARCVACDFSFGMLSFGLRNMADTGQALAELLRVTRPGGRLVVCEFSHLPVRRLNGLYERYLTTALPVIARRLSGNAEAYDYLAESIKAWPPQNALAGKIAGAGWSGVGWRNLSLGVVA